MLRKYTVQPGDTLISIAEKFYGDPKAFTDIFNANQDVIEDPYNLAPGTDLYIPPSATEGAPGDTTHTTTSSARWAGNPLSRRPTSRGSRKARIRSRRNAAWAARGAEVAFWP